MAQLIVDDFDKEEDVEVRVKVARSYRGCSQGEDELSWEKAKLENRHNGKVLVIYGGENPRNREESWEHLEVRRIEGIDRCNDNDFAVRDAATTLDSSVPEGARRVVSIPDDDDDNDDPIETTPSAGEGAKGAAASAGAPPGCNSSEPDWVLEHAALCTPTLLDTT